MSEPIEPVTTSFLKAILIERLAGARSRGQWHRAIAGIVIEDHEIGGANWTVRASIVCELADAQRIHAEAVALMAQYPLAVEG